MKKLKIRNSMNYTRVAGESNFGPSLAVPNQSLTITQILQRYTSGTLPEIKKPVYFDPESNLDDIPLRTKPDFDIVDVTLALAEAQVKNRYAQAVIDELKKKSDAKAADTTPGSTPSADGKDAPAKQSGAQKDEPTPKAQEPGKQQ